MYSRSAPLRMQSFHCAVGAPERYTMKNQPLAVAVEQIVGAGAVQPFAHRPDVRVNDAASERTVECLNLERQC